MSAIGGQHGTNNKMADLVLGALPLPLLLAAAAVVLLPLLYLILRPRTPPAFLDPSQFKEVTLVTKEVVNHNTRLFRFALDHPKQRLGLPIGQHITFKAKMMDGKDCFRPYTPVSDDDQLGFVDFVIKVYEEGKMSKYVDSMVIGQKLLFKGPKGRFSYEPNKYKSIGMIAGGSGITPMYQVANAVLKNPSDRTQVSLIYANVSEDDILLRDELDALARMHPNFKVYYVLNNPPAGWAGGSGFASADMIKERCAAPGDGCVVLRCGPGPMNRAMEAHLGALGYTADMQFEF